MWLPRRRRWTLIDFGCAAQIGQEVAMAFSLFYAAPEVLQAREGGCQGVLATAALDAWSVGILALEMFTGQPVFDLTQPKAQVGCCQGLCPPKCLACMLASQHCVLPANSWHFLSLPTHSYHLHFILHPDKSFYLDQVSLEFFAPLQEWPEDHNTIITTKLFYAENADTPAAILFFCLENHRMHFTCTSHAHPILSCYLHEQNISQLSSSSTASHLTCGLLDGPILTLLSMNSCDAQHEQELFPCT
jgi:hypothetical protein